ncbi:hypothetical protein M569_07978, partial [Genlisea aurea]
FFFLFSGPIYWPEFVIAVAAAIIASQAMISGAFAIISQSLALGCFPRVKVVHTSAKYEGQVYIPEINYFLMIACVIVTFAFKTTTNIGNAYGIAVVAVMLITTSMLTLIMLVIWKLSIWLIILFAAVFLGSELIYFSSVLYKFVQGGYLPLSFSLVLMLIMATWHYAHKQRYLYELKNKVSSDYVKDLANNPDIGRLPGIGLLYSELVQGIPPIFPHFIENVPSVHSVVIFVSIKSIPISKVLPEERFLFRQVEPKEFRVFRCVVRYGYKDVIKEAREFERQLLDSLINFLLQEKLSVEAEQSGPLKKSGPVAIHVEESLDQITGNGDRVSSASIQNVIRSGGDDEEEEEIQFLQKSMDQGVFYLMGEADVVAHKDSSLVKKF